MIIVNVYVLFEAIMVPRLPLVEGGEEVNVKLKKNSCEVDCNMMVKFKFMLNTNLLRISIDYN